MCLTTLTKTNKTITEGYKCFEKVPWHNYQLDNIHQYIDNLEINKWLKARQQLIHIDEFDFKSESYMSGFHFFETLYDARIYTNELRCTGIIIKKILVQDITASGTQKTFFKTISGDQIIHLPCHIAFKMLILPGDYQTCFTEPDIFLPRRR